MLRRGPQAARAEVREEGGALATEVCSSSPSTAQQRHPSTPCPSQPLAGRRGAAGPVGGTGPGLGWRSWLWGPPAITATHPRQGSSFCCKPELPHSCFSPNWTQRAPRGVLLWDQARGLTSAATTQEGCVRTAPQRADLPLWPKHVLCIGPWAHFLNKTSKIRLINWSFPFVSQNLSLLKIDFVPKILCISLFMFLPDNKAPRTAV